jgi:transposase-like protein
MSRDKNKPVAVKRAVASGAATGKRGRFSAPRKAQAVLRLLRGEDLELLSRELGVVASTLSLWREQFLAAGQSSLKGKTGKTDERDDHINRLKKKVGELTMDNELLREKAQRLEENLPLARRRSRR